MHLKICEKGLYLIYKRQRILLNWLFMIGFMLKCSTILELKRQMNSEQEVQQISLY